MKKLALIILVIMAVGIIISCGNKKKEPDNQQKLLEFIIKLEKDYRPLYVDFTTVYFESQVTGDSLKYVKLEELKLKMNKLFANKDDYNLLKSIKEANDINDPVLKRQLTVLYNMFLSKQADEKKLEAIVKLETEIEQMNSKYRVVIGKDTLTDNDVESVLRDSKDSKKLQAVWEQHKKVGELLSPKILELVKLRNGVAKDLGFNNFHEMSLKLSEQDPEQILNLFNELDSLTSSSFAAEKEKIDNYLAKKMGIAKDKLMPWHYQNRYFQEAPQIYNVDFDKFYSKFQKEDFIEITKKYFSGIGIDISDLITKSDLYEKPNKNQHAFCIDINNQGDVRVLCNVVNNEYWMNTVLHEYGHAAYDKYIDNSLPFVLRDPAHTFTTEAVAQFFGRLSKNPAWIQTNLSVPEKDLAGVKEESFNMLRLEMLVFSRWSQVMYRFEKSLYENPDQNLNALWWSLVEKYQMVKKPEGRNAPDWASKVHIATSPCYYHNYLMGELLASQFYHHIAKNILKSDDLKFQSFTNNPEIGSFFIENVFKPGMKWEWNEMIEKATGEKLTAKYYAMQFVQ